MAAIVTSDQWGMFEVHPDRQNEVKEFRDRMSAASRRLADALGGGWTPREATRLGYGPEAVPMPENAAELPTSYAHVIMTRDVIPGHSDVFLDQVCRGMTEKGRESGSCDESTTPSGEPIYLQWSRSVDHSQSVPHDELWVMYVNDEDAVVRVMLSVSDDPELSTPERRAAIVAWIEQQVDAMIAAATAEDATTR
jgi:hypothetical protein